MKILFCVFLLGITLSLTAQDSYEKYMLLSYAEIDSLVGVEYQVGDFDKAIVLLQAGREKARKESGIQDSMFVFYTMDLAFFYYQTAKYENALDLYIQANELQSKILGKNHPSVASSLDGQAIIYHDMGDYKKALELSIEAKNIREKSLGKENIKMANSLNNIATLYQVTGDYPKALLYFTEAKVILEKIKGKNSKEMVVSFNNLALLYQDMGNYSAAELLFKETKALDEKFIGKEHPNFANTLHNLANLYHDMGNYAEALPFYIQAKDIREKVLGKEHPLYATTLDNLAALHRDMGNYSEALSFAIESKNIREKVLGKEHSLYGSSVNNLAAIYQNIDDYAKALSLSMEAKEVYEKKLGKEHPNFATVLANLADLQKKMKDYNGALQLLYEARDIREQTLGKEHPFYVNTIYEIALIYQAMGNYDKALTLLLETKDVREKNLGKAHPNYAINLYSLGNLYFQLGQIKQSQTYYSELLSQRMDYLVNQGETLGEKAKQNLFKTVVPHMDNVNFFAAFYRQHDSLLIKVQESVMLSKGYALAGISELLPMIQSLKDSSLTAVYDLWIYNKHQLGKFHEMSVAERNEKGIKIDSLERVLAEQETLLMRSSAALKDRLGYNKKRFYYKDLMSNISKKEVTIDFVRFGNEKKDTIWYYALVTQQDWQYPKYIPLCTEKQLEFYTAASINPNQENYITKSTWSKQLYELLINPLEPYFKNKKIIHWAPVGLMNQIAMNTLQDAKGKMLGKKMEIHQYGSLKDFIIKKTGEGSTGSVDNNALLVGDIAFDLNEIEHINLAENSKTENLYTMRSAPMDSTRGVTRFVPLKGTKIEVENLHQAFSSKKWRIEQLQQKDALEEKVREYSGVKTPKVLHFATHGFFISAKKQGHDDPLLRSGIALAGANRVWMGKPRIEGVEDGLWTAYEIANIDLSPAELVVLSACETAKGQIDPHEGVVGLQRAFKIAGVENMLLSLWQVPDKETVELMQEFYKYYLNGETPAVSLKKAQNIMHKKYPSPYYWAAFILIE